MQHTRGTDDGAHPPAVFLNVTSPADGTPARASHLRLMDPVADHPSARALIDEARGLDRLGRRDEARARYEQALEALDLPAPSVASMLLRWIARTYEVDADFGAAEDCAIAAVATAELGDERNALGHAHHKTRTACLFYRVKHSSGEVAAEQDGHSPKP